MSVEAFAADTLLERGLRLPISVPLFFRLLGIRAKCYQPSLGNKIRINRRYLPMKLAPEKLKQISLTEADELMIKHGNRLSQIVAFGMVKGWLAPLILVWFIGKWIKWYMQPKHICAIAYVMIAQSGTADFIDTTRCIDRMQILLPQLGQEIQRS